MVFRVARRNMLFAAQFSDFLLNYRILGGVKSRKQLLEKKYTGSSKMHNSHNSLSIGPKTRRLSRQWARAGANF